MNNAPKELDAAFLIYCKNKNLDPNNPITTFKFAAFLKIGLKFLIKSMFTTPKNEEKLLDALHNNDTTNQRIRLLEGQHTETIIKAIDAIDIHTSTPRYYLYLVTGVGCVIVHLFIVLVHDIILRRKEKWVDKF